jgi:predicted DNA-binding mobile mystery protein A
MRKKEKILIEQLDEKLNNFKPAQSLTVPPRGWIHAIRTALNMTMEQLGKKLNITRQGVKNIEVSESKGSISLNSLEDVANAMDLKLVYGFVPKHGSLNHLIAAKSQKLAKKIVLRTNQNMVLENQGIESDKINRSIQELAEELKREMKKSLWD